MPAPTVRFMGRVMGQNMKTAYENKTPLNQLHCIHFVKLSEFCQACQSSINVGP